MPWIGESSHGIFYILKLFFILVLIVFELSSCAQIPNPQSRTKSAVELAQASGWQIEYSSNSPIAKFRPKLFKTAKTLTIYIEGDGYAWVSRDLPSFDPTPLDPLALKLALLDPRPAAYLGRPCQYMKVRNILCEQKYWTTHRFSKDIINLMGREIDVLKQSFHSQRLILVGYSGGGAIAALVAAERSDVIQLITVAGNLDIEAWAKELHLSPLAGSMNPADSWQLLQSIPQVHLIGSQDKVINLKLLESFKARFPVKAPIDIRVMQGYSHRCCWTAQWESLIESLRPNK